MEYDGGLSREDAERHAAAGFSYQYARAREAGEPPMSEAVPEADKPATVESAKPVSVAAKLEAWGDLRPAPPAATSCEAVAAGLPELGYYALPATISRPIRSNPAAALGTPRKPTIRTNPQARSDGPSWRSGKSESW